MQADGARLPAKSTTFLATDLMDTDCEMKRFERRDSLELGTNKTKHLCLIFREMLIRRI